MGSSMQSRRSTASATDIMRPKQKTQSFKRFGLGLFASPIARRILLANIAGLIVLVMGALIVNELRAGLVQARIESLDGQAQLTGSLIEDLATRGAPEPTMDPDLARALLARVELSPNIQMRVFDLNGAVVADTRLLEDMLETEDLPPLGEPRGVDLALDNVLRPLAQALAPFLPRRPDGVFDLTTLEDEHRNAIVGEASSGQRLTESGRRVVSVSVPIQRVSAVVGILTVEASDVEAIIRAERAALIPFALVAILVAVLSAVLMTVTIARPLRRLAAAADQVRAGDSARLEMPALERRRDEIGELASALSSMTDALRQRIESNERFAADVAHELKNPLTSIRAAVETADAVDDPDVRQRLRHVIATDVSRLDRLITDISSATRLEASFARQPQEPLDLTSMLSEICEAYAHLDAPDPDNINAKRAAGVVFKNPGFKITVFARAESLARVFRNLIDNARSFSPQDGSVRVSVVRVGADARVYVDDDGPGVPADNLERIFDRFYTDRPSGASFGTNSGLGLSIARDLVSSHNGRLWAENRHVNDDVVGARFAVALPVARRTEV